MLIYITCYQISFQEPKTKPNLFPKALFPGFGGGGGGGKLPGDEVGLDLSALVLCSWLLTVFNAFLRSTSSLWCTRTMRASVKIHLAPLRDLIKKPELLWYDVLLFFIC